MAGTPTTLLPPPNRLPSPLPPPPFLSMPKWPTLMLPPPAATRRPHSLPDPIKGAHTLVGAHCPRLHSPFLPSSLGALPSPSYFSRRHLSLSPGHLVTFRSQVRSQVGSSPPPPPFWLPSVSIGELERRPGHPWCARSTQPRTQSTLHLGPCLYSKSTRSTPFSKQTPGIFQN
jgi:hypothetical protein